VFASLWRLLLLPVIGLCLMLLLAVFLYQHTYPTWQERQAEYEQAVQQTQAAMVAWQHWQDWQAISPQVLTRYLGLQTSGQWGEQSRLTWLKEIENRQHTGISQMSLQFSSREALAPETVIGLNIPPLTVRVERLQVKAVARHEWHALNWVRLLDQQLLPTSLLQSSEWQLLAENDGHKEGMVALTCTWILMEMTE